MPNLTVVRDDGVEKGFDLREIPAGEASSIPVLTRSAPGSTPMAPASKPAVPVLSPCPPAPVSSPLDPLLESSDPFLEAAAPEAPQCGALPAANQPAAVSAAVAWPGAVPSSAAAEALLLSAVAGSAAADASQLAAAQRVLAASSELERAALSGADVPVDPVFLRSAAALRLRLDIAIGSLPAAGGAVDQPAAQQLLVDVDGVLAQLKAIGAAAPPGVMPALDPMRLTMVDGGVRLAGALSQLVPVGASEAVVPKVEQKPTTRVLSNDRAVQSGGLGSSSKALWVALALVFAAVAGYHGWRLATMPAPTPPPSLPGAPAKTYSVQMGPMHLLKTLAGEKVNPAELERFKVQEQAKGNVVRDLGSGTWAVEPGAAGGGTKP